MKTIKNQVLKKIDSMDTGKIFTIRELSDSHSKNSKSIYYAINIAIADKKIEKLSRGKYFKPKKTKYGSLKPKDNDVIKYVINEIYTKTKSKPFFASNTIYQKLGLTTQISNEIFIVCNVSKNSQVKLKNLKINLISYQGKWNKKDVKYLEYLYALEHIRDIPDTSSNDAIKILNKHIENYKTQDIVNLVRVSENYSNFTKYLLSIILLKNGYMFAAKTISEKIDINKKKASRYIKKIKFEEKEKNDCFFKPEYIFYFINNTKLEKK